MTSTELRVPERAPGPALSVFEYVDYRKFLRDFYETQKKRSASYSYRVFADKAGLTSPNYLKLVIDGSRRITDKSLPKFIRGLRLSPQESQFFKSLVLYQESNDAEAKGLHLRELCAYRQRHSRNAKHMKRDEIESLASWHHWVIKEMVTLNDFSPDPTWIASRLRHKITPQQAAESLQLLVRIGILEQKEGKYQARDALSTTPDDDIASLLIQDLHRSFLNAAIDSLANDTPGDREMNGLIIPLAKNSLPQMKTAVREFRRELNKRFSSPQNNEEIYYLNVSLFPLTRRKK